MEIIKKLWEMACLQLRQFRLEGFNDDYEGFIISEDIAAFRIINEFRKYCHIKMEQLASWFETMGYELPFEVHDCNLIDSVKIGDDIIEFFSIKDNPQIWRRRKDGKVEKYRLNHAGEAEFYEWTYKSEKGVKYFLWCNFKESTIKLLLEDQKGIEVKVKMANEEGFRSLCESMAAIILEKYDQSPLVIYRAIKEACRLADGISVVFDAPKAYGGRGHIAKVYSTGDTLHEVTVLYRGAYLWVKTNSCWCLTSIDGKMSLRRKDLSTPIKFEGVGDRADVSFFTGIEGIQEEVERLVRFHGLS